jgi:RNA polymerase sigma factor for flagellar operon FliA
VSAARDLHEGRTLTSEEYRRYLPMVRRSAMRFARKVPAHITVNDLIGYGWIGLVEAFNRAAPEMGPEEFEAYASYRVRGAMLDHLRRLDPHTRKRRAQSKEVARAISQLTGRLCRPPEEDEVARELSLDVPSYRELLQELDAAGMTRVEMLDFTDELPQNDVELPEQAASKGEQRTNVAAAVSRLPERMQLVLSLLYAEECTLREVGAILGVTESRACQLHSEAVHRLRAEVGGE